MANGSFISFCGGRSVGNFIEDLDRVYRSERRKNNIKRGNNNFWIFIPLEVDIYGEIYNNYMVRKGEFTKYIYTRNNCRVYFSDADILTMLLQIINPRTIDLLIEYLIAVYNGNAEKYTIILGEKSYEVKGIPLIQDGQILTNLQDIDISFEELLVLINLILSKDIESIPLWHSKPDFLKQTCAKYITLLKFYYNNDTDAEKYLSALGYDTEKDILSNYDTKKKRDEKNSFFSDFDSFEKSGII